MRVHIRQLSASHRAACTADITVSRSDLSRGALLARDRGRDRTVLREVACRRACAVRVDIAYVLRRDAGPLQREPHARRDAGAVGPRLGHVVRVAVDGAAEKLGVDARAAALRVFEALEHKHAAALAHDEAVAVLVPGARRSGGVVVAAAERLARDEATDAGGYDRRVSRASEHQVRLAGHDVAVRVQHAVVAGCARRRDRVVRAHEACVHREQRAAHVRDRERDAEGVHLLVACQDRGATARERRHAAHRGADERAPPERVRALKVPVHSPRGFDAAGTDVHWSHVWLQLAAATLQSQALATGGGQTGLSCEPMPNCKHVYRAA
jgi:hypothetical protein